MKKLAATTLNIILALGVVCILAGILLFPRLASHFNAHVETWTVILTVVGALVFYFSLVKYSSALVFFLCFYVFLTKDRRIRVSYLFPSVFLIGMGFYFLLFSLNLISMGFRKWISIFWPLFPVLLGICLIILFLIQQNPAAHFPYDKSESLENDFEEDAKE